MQEKNDELTFSAIHDELVYALGYGFESTMAGSAQRLKKRKQEGITREVEHPVKELCQYLRITLDPNYFKANKKAS